MTGTHARRRRLLLPHLRSCVLRPAAMPEAPVTAITLPLSRSDMAARIRRLAITTSHLQTEDDFRLAIAQLTSRDPQLASAVSAYGQPEYWHRPPGFSTLVLFILEQQVSLASGAAAFNRLKTRIGEMTPEKVLNPNDDELRADGFSRQKTRYVRALARSVMAGVIGLDELVRLDNDEVRRRLVALIGIGPWTAEVYLLSCLRRPDIWPIHDRALQVATAEVLELGRVPAPAELQSIGDRWRPHRSAVARLLWHSYLARRGRKETAL
jgi:DNA-3-methyladenine glycosylase II